MRTTRKHVEAEIERLYLLMQKYGLLSLGTNDWDLQQGSQTYGRAWRLYAREKGTGGLRTLPWLSQGYLGDSASQALETLYTVRRALEWLIHDEVIHPYSDQV